MKSFDDWLEKPSDVKPAERFFAMTAFLIYAAVVVCIAFTV